jgi:hypothetical protein
MADDRSVGLIEDIIEGIAHGDVAGSVPEFRISRLGEAAIEVDVGDLDSVYVVRVSRVERVD